MTPDQLQANLNQAAAEFRPATELLREVGRVERVAIQGEIRKRAYKTGRMHDSVVERVMPESVSVGPTVDYAVYVNDGTRYMEGRHFMEAGQAAAHPELERVLQQWGNMVLGRVAGR